MNKAIESLEKTTFMVSEIGLFSDNETVDELPTTSLKFLLLPALLGALMLKRTTLPRTEALKFARIYYLDFFKRCKDYSITNLEIPSTTNQPSALNDGNQRTSKQPTIEVRS